MSDSSSKRFRVAFSFAGEKRAFVAKVAEILAKKFGEAAILYDAYHEAEFAQYRLGIDLPALYHSQSDLNVVVLCPKYKKKSWTGLEWVAIHALLMGRNRKRVMLTRFQHATVKGLYANAGFVELDKKTPEQAAILILQRLAVNEKKGKNCYITGGTVISAATRSTIPNNLPRLQPFFGREKELAEIRTALDPESHGWGMLIDGEGGMGKTSLAIRAAYDVPATHFQRIIFVSLKQRVMDGQKERKLGSFALANWTEMLNEIARELGRSDILKALENERENLVRDALKEQKVLLLLDNLETLPDAEQDQLLTFLDRLPDGCKALLTSRKFAGNKLQAWSLHELDQAAGMKLLDEVARHNPAFGKSSATERERLFVETGGRPLLLAWTAGQVGTAHCTTIADALELLGSCPKGNDPLAFIFQDVAASLAPEEIRILASLTWPTQPIPVVAIAEIGEVAEADTGRFLKALTNRALVVPDQDEKRYRLVPLVANFLRTHRLEAIQKTGSRLEERAFALIQENGKENYDRFPSLEAAWPTVAPALPLMIAGPNERLQTACDALQSFFDFNGRWDEWLVLSQRAEARAVAAGDHSNAGWRAYQSGMVHYLRGEAKEVFVCADRARQHWIEAGTGVRELAIVTSLRGIGHDLKGEFPEATAVYRESLDLYLTLSAESADVASALNDLATAELGSGSLDAAEKDYREALRVARKIRFPQGIATYLGNLALVEIKKTCWKEAESLAREALVSSEEIGRQELIAEHNGHLALALVRQGKAPEALPCARKAVDIYTYLRSPDLKNARSILKECEGVMEKAKTAA